MYSHIEINEAQRETIISNMNKKIDGTNARQLQAREWKPSNGGATRIYINLLVKGGSVASAQLIGNEIVIEKGAEVYRANLSTEIMKWLGC